MSADGPVGQASGFPTVSFLEVDGKVLSGEEFEEYCKDHGLCRRCARVKTHKRSLKLFGRGKKWEPLTLHDEESGEYTVYKGYCLQPTCYTIGQAKRLLGESGNRRKTRRQRMTKKFKNRRRRTKRNPETGSVMSGDSGDDDDDDKSVSSFMSGLGSILSGASFRSSKHKNRLSSASSTASLVSSYDFSDDDTIDSAMTPMPVTLIDGEVSPIVKHRVEQLEHDYFTVMDLSKVELREVDIDAIVSALLTANTLEAVVMDKCKLKDDGLERVCAALIEAGHTTIKRLSLRQNQIGNQGAASFYKLLETSATLEILDLSENSISSRGACSVIGALHKNPNTAIKTLNLAQNEIWDMDDGSFLKNNTTLKTCNLDGNFMHDEGAEQIADAIASNPKSVIERLYLGWNGIADDGASALAKMMEANATLQVLGLAENDISNTGARAILSALAVNTSVREISGLYHNQIDRKFIIVAIKRLLHRYGERNQGAAASSEDESAPAPSGDAVDLTAVREVEKATGDAKSDDSSETSLNWAAQLYSTEEAEQEKEVATVHQDSIRRSSVALEAIETWDWGTFGIEEIEAAGDGPASPSHSPKNEVKDAVAVEPAIPAPHLSGELPTDRVTVFQSCPLAYFNRQSQEHHAVSLIDFEYESRNLKEALEDDIGLGAKIEVEFENATSDRFNVFFSHGGSSVVHFSCFGHPDFLAMENGFGYMQALSSDDLRRYVSYAKGNVKVVLVSSNHPEKIAKAFIGAGVPHVVCCRRDGVFRDAGSVEFAKAFYQALAKNKSLKEAFDVAVEAVRTSPLVKTNRGFAHKYLLLPEKPDGDPYHDTKVFFQNQLRKRPEVVMPDTSTLPKVPEHFVGREVDMYEILESLRVDDVVRVGGPPGCGKASVVAAVSRYVLERPKSFQINSVFWLPPPKGVVAEEDTLYGDLDFVMSQLIEAEDDIWDEEDYTDARDRILVELEGKRVVFVIDGRHFESEAAGENLERFLSYLLNEVSLKIILLTATEVKGSATRTSRSRSEETIINIGPLDFKSSAVLFGESSKFVSITGCPVAHTAEEFAGFLVPPSVAQTVDQPTRSKTTSNRQKTLYEKMGKGNPRAIVETAANMPGSEFLELLSTARRPEIKVTSAGALESQVIKRTAQRDKAIKYKNFARAQDLASILEELDGLREKFPSLTDLLAQERSMKRELTGALAQRKYDQANKIKRKMLALKKTIMKEKNAQPTVSAAKYTAGGKLQELQAQMDNMLKMAADMGKSLSEMDASQTLQDDADSAKFTISRESGPLILHINYGTLVDFDFTAGTSGMVCWSNESLDLSLYGAGQEILEYGGDALQEALSEVPTVIETQWGPVKCETGTAARIGPRAFSKLVASFLVCAVSPLSPSNDDDDWDGDENQDADALHYLDTSVRSAYRSSFRMINDTPLEAVAFTTNTTKQTGGTYDRTLSVGLQTLVEEAKFTKLKSVYLFTSSKKESTTLIKMALDMGLTVAV